MRVDHNMAYTNNRFCWLGVVSTDLAKTTPFYTEVLGWSAETIQMGDNEATMLKAADGKSIAHTAAPAMDGVPSHWNNYLRVQNVDKSAKLAEANGGKVLVPGTDIPPGRFAVVTSPSGATFSLFREADESASDAGDGEGSIHWTELHSTDLDADLAWLKSTFGYTTEVMDMPQGAYHVLMSGDAKAGGAMAQAHEGAPSMWLTWVKMADVDAAVGRASQHGGKVIAPAFEVPNVGYMAILADPTGGVFGVITPAAAS